MKHNRKSIGRYTPLGLFWALTTGRFSSLNGFDEVKNRFKFAVRSALTLPWTLRWLGTFNQQPALLEYLHQAPRLACKLHRPYLYRSLGAAGKVAVLKAHYSHIAKGFTPAVRRILLSHDSLTLATLEGKDGARFSCTLTHNHSFDKEGELSLQFVDEQVHAALAKLTFTICQQNAQLVIIVGGLQGPRKTLGGESIRSATKACHGLFPKRLALEALIGIAQHIGCQQILAVCKDEHIYSSWRYRRDFQADYDSFWESLGSSKTGRHFFRTPFPIPRKAMEDIASKKRSEYTRRYALLDSLEAQIHHSLHQE
ncbi:MAG TPA: VirK/YbjX family protein [Pseudogulbenkiania sp.]|nr:VirK/YbjX family protein [Pseudogulbenkiania sp.]